MPSKHRRVEFDSPYPLQIRTIMKKCTNCLMEKDLSNFHKRTKSKDGLSSICRECRKTIDRNSYINSQSRREQIKCRRSSITKYNRRLLQRYKRICKCLICRETEPVALDLHHISPEEKDMHPSGMASYSTDNLRKEIRKCVVLCSNCHRKLHAGIIKLPI